MTFDISPASIRARIHAFEPLQLTRACGTSLRAVAGVAWVTVDHDSRDWVLEPGDELTIESSERVLVTALGRGETTIDVRAPQPRRQAQGFRAWAAAIAQSIGAWSGTRRPSAGATPA